MAKKTKDEGFNPKKALKKFTNATLFLLQDNLKDVDIDSFITNVYLNSKNPNVQFLIKEYEKELIKVVLNKETHSELHEFFLRTSKTIKDKKMVRDFFELFYLAIVELKKKKDDASNLSYFNILAQQCAYITGTTKKVVYGTSSNGSILYTDEIGRNLSEINYELTIEKAMSDEKYLLKLCSKYGYKLSHPIELENIINYDRLVTNMLFMLAYFIDDDNKFLLPKPYRDLQKDIHMNRVFYEMEEVRNLEYIKDRLLNRNNFLPQDGILAIYENCGDIKEVFYIEKIINDKVVLLYKTKYADDTYSLGFYDVSNAMSSYTFDSNDNGVVNYVLTEIFILQNYLNLTVNLLPEEKEQYIRFTNKSNLFNQPVVKYKMKNPVNQDDLHRTRDFNKDIYNVEWKKVDVFTRNLPMGATASEEAIAFAQKLGIELPKGKTIVKEFSKKVYTK